MMPNNDILVVSYAHPRPLYEHFLVLKFPIYSGRIKNSVIYFVFVLFHDILTQMY